MPEVGVTGIRETWIVSCGFQSPRSSLLQTHAPIPSTLLSFGLSLVRGVSAGCYQPLLPAGPSRRYLCESFPGCLGPCHGGPVECICLFLPPRSSAFPRTLSRSASRFSPSKRFHDGSLFLQPFLYVQAPKFARLPDRSYRYDLSSQGSRGFYVRRTCFVASACIGYANHPPRQLVVWGLTPH